MLSLCSRARYDFLLMDLQFAARESHHRYWHFRQTFTGQKDVAEKNGWFQQVSIQAQGADKLLLQKKVDNLWFFLRAVYLATFSHKPML